VPYWKLHEVSTLFSIPPKLLALTPPDAPEDDGAPPPLLLPFLTCVNNL